MWLKKAADSAESWVSPVVSAAGKLAAWLIAVMMILTVIDVVGRRVFNKPLAGAFELNQLLMLVVTFLAIAYCELLRGHVSVDFIVDKLHQKTQNIIDSITYFIFLVTFAIISWQFALYVVEVFEWGFTTAYFGVPIYLFIIVITFGCVLLSIMLLIHLLQYIAGVIRE